MKSIAKSIGMFSKKPASPKPTGKGPMVDQLGGARDPLASSPQRVSGFASPASPALPATDIAGRSVVNVPKTQSVAGNGSPGQLASIVTTSSSGSSGNDRSPPFSPTATVTAPDTVRMQVASSLVQKGMQVGTAELAAEHIAGVRGLASPSPGTLSALADPARSPSTWSGVSAGGGTLKEYHLQMQYGDLQRAAHARQHVEQCAVCQDMFATKGPRTPKIAPCLHSICKQCIESLPNRMCPMDFLKVGDSAATESLHTNWMVLAHIDMANLQQGRPRHCDLCDDESSESVSAQYCSHCNLHLCQLHAFAHQRSKDTKSHQLMSFPHFVANLRQEHPSALRVARNLKPLMCSEPGHQDQRVDMWCAVCEIMICVQCALHWHRDHYIGPLDDEVYMRQTQEMRSMLAGLQDKQETLVGAVNGVSAVMESLDRNAEIAAAAADAQIDALIQELQNRRAELKAQISAIYNDKRKTLERQKNYLDRCMVRFDCAADFTRLLLEQEDRERVLLLKKMVSSSLSETQRNMDAKTIRRSGKERRACHSFVNGTHLVCVEPHMWTPKQDDIVEYRESGFKAVTDAAFCVGQVAGERLRDRAYLPKWDASRKGNDVVLVNNDTTVYRVDKRGWGGALGAQVMAMGKYHFTLRLENISQNTLVGIAYTDVNLNDGASRRNVVLKENGEFWVFGEKRGSFPHAQLANEDTLRIEVDMDAKQVVFIKNGVQVCSAGNLVVNTRPFVSLGNADALVTLM